MSGFPRHVLFLGTSWQIFEKLKNLQLVWVLDYGTQDCGLGLDVSISRRTNVSSQSHLDR